MHLNLPPFLSAWRDENFPHHTRFLSHLSRNFTYGQKRKSPGQKSPVLSKLNNTLTRRMCLFVFHLLYQSHQEQYQTCLLKTKLFENSPENWLAQDKWQYGRADFPPLSLVQLGVAVH